MEESIYGLLTVSGGIEAAIDRESFRANIEQILVPTLHPGDLVIADNLGGQQVAGIRRGIQAAGAPLWHVPPHSPDQNPTELCSAKLKALAGCRGAASRNRVEAPARDVHFPETSPCLVRQ